jgi:hypothetical protein
MMPPVAVLLDFTTGVATLRLNRPDHGNDPKGAERQSFETGPSDQLDAEKQSMVDASSTDDAQEGIAAAFVARRRPQFRG